MIHFEPTVSFDRLQPQMVLALRVAEGIWAMFGYELWITSANDGTHAGKPVIGGLVDPHFEGKAVDIRCKNMTGPAKRAAVPLLIKNLAPQFVVIWEDQGGDNEHVHIQYGRIGA